MDWQFDDERPIYTQIVEQVERALVNGAFPPGSRLPGVRELAVNAGVNPNTMQRALAELEGRGLLKSERTAGRYVTEDAAAIAALRQQLATRLSRQYLAGMRALGCNEQEILRHIERAGKEE